MAQFPFDWKRTLAFAPHQDTAAMVYLNTASRHAGPRCRPSARSTTPGPTTEAIAEARHPETGIALFPQIVDTAEAYGVDPAREGIPT